MSWLLVILGLGVLVAGGEAMVRGASGLAVGARLSQAVIGMTVVAAGTSMPELVVSLQAALRGQPGIALGNVVGSNLFNIGIVIGVAALIRPLRIYGNTLRLEWPVMMLAGLQLLLLARDGTLDRLEGAVLLLAIVIFTACAIWISRHVPATTLPTSPLPPLASPTAAQPEDEIVTASFGATGGKALAFNLLAVLLGIGLLAGGAELLVQGASSIAAGLGMSPSVIGLTIVAVGTSTPEMVTALVATRRGRDDIAVATVVGSNIFNVLFILGATAVVSPLPIGADFLNRDIWWMLGVSLLLLPFIRSGMRINRVEGMVLIGSYVTWLGFVLHGAIR